MSTNGPQIPNQGQAANATQAQAATEESHAETGQQKAATSKTGSSKRLFLITAIICAASLIFALVTFTQNMVALNRYHSLENESAQLEQQAQTLHEQVDEAQTKLAEKQVKPWCDSVNADSTGTREKIDQLLKQLKMIDPNEKSVRSVCGEKYAALTASLDYSRVSARTENGTIKCEQDGNHVRLSGKIDQFKGPEFAQKTKTKADLTLTITYTLEGTTDTATSIVKVPDVTPGGSKDWNSEADLPGRALTCRVTNLQWWPSDLK